MIAKHLSQKLTTGCWVFRWVPGALTPFTPYAVVKKLKTKWGKDDSICGGGRGYRPLITKLRRGTGFDLVGAATVIGYLGVPQRIV